MKRLIALVLLVVLVAMVLTGCAKQAADDEDALQESERSLEETEDISEYDIDMVAEDEVDIGEMV